MEDANANAVIDTAIIAKIAAHYRHAKQKHPYFADCISAFNSAGADWGLDSNRSCLKREIEIGRVQSTTVLYTEIAEMVREVVHKNNAHAIEECYDAIAVLLRIIDVLEDRQKLGK